MKPTKAAPDRQMSRFNFHFANNFLHMEMESSFEITDSTMQLVESVFMNNNFQHDFQHGSALEAGSGGGRRPILGELGRQPDRRALPSAAINNNGLTYNNNQLRSDNGPHVIVNDDAASSFAIGSPDFESSFIINDDHNSASQQQHGNFSFGDFNKQLDRDHDDLVKNITGQVGGDNARPEPFLQVATEPSSGYGTVCIKNNGEREKPSNDVPWKNSELKDLFSPLKLEQLFHPPAGQNGAPSNLASVASPSNVPRIDDFNISELLKTSSRGESNDESFKSKRFSSSFMAAGTAPAPNDAHVDKSSVYYGAELPSEVIRIRKGKQKQKEESRFINVDSMFEGSVSPLMQTNNGNQSMVSDILTETGEKFDLSIYVQDDESTVTDFASGGSGQPKLPPVLTSNDVTRDQSQLPDHLLAASSPFMTPLPSKIITGMQNVNHVGDVTFEPGPSSSSSTRSHSRPRHGSRKSSLEATKKRPDLIMEQVDDDMKQWEGDNPNKSSIRLFQLHYDTATKDRLKALVTELEQVDVNAVPAIEDDLGIDMALKRLKLSEKSVVIDNAEDVSGDSSSHHSIETVIAKPESVPVTSPRVPLPLRLQNKDKSIAFDYDDPLSVIAGASMISVNFNKTLGGPSLDEEIQKFEQDQQRLSEMKKEIGEHRYVPIKPYPLPEQTKLPAFSFMDTDDDNAEDRDEHEVNDEPSHVESSTYPDKSLANVEKAFESLRAIKADITMANVPRSMKPTPIRLVYPPPIKEKDCAVTLKEKLSNNSNVVYSDDELIIPPSCQVESIYGLSHIYDNIKSLKVDGNRIHLLGGAPLSLMRLSANYNNLSAQTQFHHLMHLQHLDLSHNRIETLKQFVGLIHLRELNLDFNILLDLKGMESLPSLVTLSAIGNRITEIGNDVVSKSLETLTLDFNHIYKIENLQMLAVLKSISARNNLIEAVSATEPHCTLKELNLAGNRLPSFDCSLFPNLVDLNLDSNAIFPDAVHVGNCRTIKSFSCRYQDISSSSSANESHINLKKWHNLTAFALSGTRFSHGIEDMLFFHRLELLDLSGCHIRQLPHKFAKRLSNLIHLDLSNNMLTDIEPLRKHRALRYLNLYGNEVSSISGLCGVLSSLTHLQTVDVRMNPITAKFYPALGESDADESTWLLQDHKFIKSMNDVTYIRRLCYRSTLIFNCSTCLIRLDGVSISEDDRRESREQYTKIRESVRRNSHIASTANIPKQHQVNSKLQRFSNMNGRENKTVSNQMVKKSNQAVTFWIPLSQQQSQSHAKPPPIPQKPQSKPHVQPKHQKQLNQKKKIMAEIPVVKQRYFLRTQLRNRPYNHTNDPAPTKTYFVYSADGKPLRLTHKSDF